MSYVPDLMLVAAARFVPKNEPGPSDRNRGSTGVPQGTVRSPQVMEGSPLPAPSRKASIPATGGPIRADF